MSAMDAHLSRAWHHIQRHCSAALDGEESSSEVIAGANMVGPIITFVFVCAIVATYMSIVHSFLRAAEELNDEPKQKPIRETKPQTENLPQRQREERWAH
jgi:hypothetical protein